MCNFASFVVTRDGVFWHPSSDGHQDIIDSCGLHEDGVRGPNIVKVELTPSFPGPELRDLLDQSCWRFKIDQDTLPEWADRAEVEDRVRGRLKEFLSGRSDLYLSGCTGLRSLPEGLKCEYLHLSGCTGLRSLPEGLKCEYLYLYGCTGLRDARIPIGVKRVIR